MNRIQVKADVVATPELLSAMFAEMTSDVQAKALSMMWTALRGACGSEHGANVQLHAVVRDPAYDDAARQLVDTLQDMQQAEEKEVKPLWPTKLNVDLLQRDLANNQQDFAAAYAHARSWNDNKITTPGSGTYDGKNYRERAANVMTATEMLHRQQARARIERSLVKRAQFEVGDVVVVDPGGGGAAHTAAITKVDVDPTFMREYTAIGRGQVTFGEGASYVRSLVPGDRLLLQDGLILRVTKVESYDSITAVDDRGRASVLFGSFDVLPPEATVTQSRGNHRVGDYYREPGAEGFLGVVTKDNGDGTVEVALHGTQSKVDLKTEEVRGAPADCEECAGTGYYIGFSSRQPCSRGCKP